MQLKIYALLLVFNQFEKNHIQRLRIFSETVSLFLLG